MTAIAEFEDAFETMRKGRAEALLVVQSNIFETPPFPIQQLALTYRIPAMYGLRTSTDAGGLISYGPNVRELYEYAAVFVAKFLRGVKPADLPVEQPTKIELVINLQTAKTLGMADPAIAAAARRRSPSIASLSAFARARSCASGSVTCSAQRRDARPQGRGGVRDHHRIWSSLPPERDNVKAPLARSHD